MPLTQGFPDESLLHSHKFHEPQSNDNDTWSLYVQVHVSDHIEDDLIFR